MEPSLRPPYGKQKGFNSLKLCFITTQYQKSENSVLLDKRYKESKCQLANPIPCSSCTLSFKLVIKLSILIDFFLFFFWDTKSVRKPHQILRKQYLLSLKSPPRDPQFPAQETPDLYLSWACSTMLKGSVFLIPSGKLHLNKRLQRPKKESKQPFPLPWVKI